jgi:hypothetical protein
VVLVFIFVFFSFLKWGFYGCGTDEFETIFIGSRRRNVVLYEDRKIFTSRVDISDVAQRGGVNEALQSRKCNVTVSVPLFPGGAFCDEAIFAMVIK